MALCNISRSPMLVLCVSLREVILCEIEEVMLFEIEEVSVLFHVYCLVPSPSSLLGVLSSNKNSGVTAGTLRDLPRDHVNREIAGTVEPGSCKDHNAFECLREEDPYHQTAVGYKRRSSRPEFIGHQNSDESTSSETSYQTRDWRSDG